jgi:hypothetical protein
VLGLASPSARGAKAGASSPDHPPKIGQELREVAIAAFPGEHTLEAVGTMGDVEKSSLIFFGDTSDHARSVSQRFQKKDRKGFSTVLMVSKVQLLAMNAA